MSDHLNKLVNASYFVEPEDAGREMRDLIQEVKLSQRKLQVWQEFFTEYDCVVTRMLSIHFGSNPLPQELHDKYQQLQVKLNG